MEPSTGGGFVEHNTQDRKVENVPYVVYSDTVANYHWVIKKLVIALIVAVVMVFASNVAWLVAWMQYDYASTETTMESDGSNNKLASYTFGDGGVIYGGEDYSPKDYTD